MKRNPRRERQERALKRRQEQLVRYGEGDYTDNRGHSIIPKDAKGEKRRKLKRQKKAKGWTEIENLERKLRPTRMSNNVS